MYEELIGNLRAQATHFSIHDETSLLLLKAADAIEDLENRLNLWRQDKIRRWIPVTERLPEPRQDVLAVWDNGEVWTVYQWWAEPNDGEDPLEYDDDVFYENGEFYSTKKRVTHWMPLPEPPKDGE